MSELEDTLARQLRAAGIEGWVRELRFAPPRRWRFDLAFPAAGQKLAVECEGGVFSGGRHVTGQGFTADCQKLSEAAVLGWRVIRVTGGMIESGEALRLIERALGGRE